MKALFKIINGLTLFSLVLFILKPVLVHTIEKPAQTKTQYSVPSSPCSNRTVVASSCPSTWQYTLEENELAVAAYFFLLAGILYYFMTKSKYKSPVSSLFKPPIFI